MLHTEQILGEVQNKLKVPDFKSKKRSSLKCRKIKRTKEKNKRNREIRKSKESKEEAVDGLVMRPTLTFNHAWSPLR